MLKEGSKRARQDESLSELAEDDGDDEEDQDGDDGDGDDFVGSHPVFHISISGRPNQ
jgi:hypothetical protein